MHPRCFDINSSTTSNSESRRSLRQNDTNEPDGAFAQNKLPASRLIHRSSNHTISSGDPASHLDCAGDLLNIFSIHRPPSTSFPSIMYGHGRNVGVCVLARPTGPQEPTWTLVEAITSKSRASSRDNHSREVIMPEGRASSSSDYRRVGVFNRWRQYTATGIADSIEASEGKPSSIFGGR